MIKALVFGANGGLGLKVSEIASLFGVEVTASTCNITCYESIRASIRASSPNVIINCAAVTDTNKEGRYGDMSNQWVKSHIMVNEIAPAFISAVAYEFGVPVLHISTDMVFFDDQPILRKEDDTKNPMCVYSQAKSNGETIALALNNTSALRVSWLFGDTHQKGFVNTIVNRLSQTGVVNVVGDQTGRPTYSGEAAYAALAIATDMAKLSKPRRRIWHLARNKPVSRYLFAVDIANEMSAITGLKYWVNETVTGVEVQPKPRYSILEETDGLRDLIGKEGVGYRDALSLTINKILTKGNLNAPTTQLQCGNAAARDGG
jgi:dTDP-4-dehydrorhamnose reductase